MSLSNLITDLKESINGRELRGRETDELVDGRVKLPDDFDKGEIEFSNLSYGGQLPLYHFLISAFPERSLDDVQPILDGFVERAKKLKLKKGVADYKYKVFWTPDVFQDEKKLTGLFWDKVKVEASAYTIDPTKVRIGFNFQSHELETTIEANRLYLRATGKYRVHLEDLVRILKPQIATLNLTKEDAERYIKKIRNTPLSKYFVPILRKALQPKEMMTLSATLFGGIQIGSKDVIEFNVFTKYLRRLETILGEPLVHVPVNQETRVTKFTKVYDLIDLIRGRRLSDLQFIAREIPDMNLETIFDHLLLSEIDAKKMLEKEIEIIGESYKEWFLFGPNTHMTRGPLVKGLANEHFGDEITAGFGEMGVDEYIAFLKSKGYKPSKTFDDPDYQEKEQHLFEFFKQSYAKNPDESIRRFREFYKNKKPKVRIYGERDNDASKLGKIKLPERARLFSFGISEHMKRTTHYSNDLNVNRTTADSDDIHFWCRTSLDSPILLPLQEYVCEEMGIAFN